MEVFRALFINLEDIRVLFFSHMVQTSLMVFVGLCLVGFRLSLRQVMMISIPVALFMYVERAAMITYQYAMIGHLFMGIIGFILAMRFIVKIPLSAAIVATIISYLILLASEAWFLLPVITYFKLDLNNIMSNPWLQCALGLLSNVPFIIVGGLSYFTRFSLLRISGGGRGGLAKISDVGFKRTLH